LFLLIQSLSKAELLDLLRCARAHSERDWLVILVAFVHGLRASEVIGITRDAITRDGLTVPRLKHSLKTTQELHSDPNPLLNEREALFDYARKLRGNQRLFPFTRRTFYTVVSRAAERAGLPKHKRHPHMLKHSIAMQTIHSAGIENVRQWLGHKNISSTGAYLKVSDADAARAISAALKV
jgi:type 1 fimbriae regulatory protein FimB